MKNLQPIEKSVSFKHGCVEIVDAWDTIQGEGPFSGMPAIFFRLAGCNLQCPMCDTDYTSNRRMICPDQIENELSRFPWRHLIVLTGGEPFRQDITAIIAKMIDLDDRRSVQIETNGTLPIPASTQKFFDLSEPVYIVCSPKTPKIHESIQKEACAFKYVLTEGKISTEDGLPLEVLGLRYRTPPARPPQRLLDACEVYVQPADEQDEMRNRLNLEATIESCKRFGYRLCLQTHKIANLP